MKRARFELGRTVATPGALRAVEAANDEMIQYLVRHHTGDWGDLCDEDQRANEGALQHGGRILSAYHLKDNTRIWIITEADRSVTTVLLPEEY